MSTYNMDQSDLRTALSAQFDVQTQNQIIDYLVDKTAFTDPDDHSRIPVQTGVSIAQPDPNANVLIELNANNAVHTDTSLAAIIENTPSNVTLIVETNYTDPDFGPDGEVLPAPFQKSDYDALIATGRGSDHVYVRANASYTILTGDGNDEIQIEPFHHNHTFTDNVGRLFDAPASSHGDYVDGGSGNDLIWDRGAGGSTLIGGSGDDYLIWSGSGVSTYDGGVYDGEKLYGGVGNDTLSANPSLAAGVELHGGDGNDVLLSGSVADPIGLYAYKLYGDEGADALYAGGGRDTLYGGAGNDTLVSGYFATGGPFSDGSHQLLDGGDGNDLILGAVVGSGGTITGGTDETLHGGAGDDVIYSLSSHANGTSNRVFGDAGQDTLIAGSGADTLSGGDDNDIIVGGDYTVSMDGDGGNDALYSLSNAAAGTVLSGGDGDDSMYSGNGADTLFGGAGNDILVGMPHSHVAEMHGGDGFDTVYSFSDAGTSTKLSGDQGDDTLYGGAGNDTLYGGSGNDLLIAGSGSQVLIGGDNGSSFVGSDTGTSSMLGGAGQDFFYLSNSASNDTIDGGGGDLDSLTFLDHAQKDVKDISAGSIPGSLDITFNNSNQVITVNNIEYLIFNDGNYTKL